MGLLADQRSHFKSGTVTIISLGFCGVFSFDIGYFSCASVGVTEIVTALGCPGKISFYK